MPSRTWVYTLVISGAALFELLLPGEVALVDQLTLVGSNAAVVVAIAEILRDKRP
jgi:hypothetical protein